jgi:hypothetical protein
MAYEGRSSERAHTAERTEVCSGSAGAGPGWASEALEGEAGVDEHEASVRLQGSVCA